VWTNILAGILYTACCQCAVDNAIRMDSKEWREYWLARWELLDISLR
jgi:hypothetical protein